MIKISKREFEKKYYSMKLKDMAKEFNVCVDTIQKIRKKLNIPIKGKGSHRKVEIG